MFNYTYQLFQGCTAANCAVCTFSECLTCESGYLKSLTDGGCYASGSCPLGTYETSTNCVGIIFNELTKLRNCFKHALSLIVIHVQVQHAKRAKQAMF